MATSTNYPRLYAWTLQFGANQSGQLAFFGLVCIIMVYLWWSHSRYPLYTRLTIVVGLGIGAVISGAGALIGGAVIGLGVLFYYWRAASARRIPALPRWALLALLALLVRVPGLTESLWYDETFTVSLARLPLDRMFVAIQSDVHPPLWYWIEWITGRILGWSEAAVRAPSLLFGVLSVLLVYRLAKSIHQNEMGATIAALIAALLPGALYYSNEARGYTLLVCAILGATIGLIENRRWLFTGSLIIAMYTHNLAFAYAGVLCVVAIMRGRSWVWACAGVSIAGAVWLPTLLAQSNDITNGFWITPMTPGAVLSPLLSMTVGGRMPDTYIAMTSGTILALILWSARISKSWIITSTGWVWMALSIGVPISIAVASLWHNVYLDRALLSSALAFCIPIGYALATAYKGDALVARIATGVMLIMALVPYWSHSSRADLRPLTRACAGADMAFTTSVSMEVVANYYAPVTTGGHSIAIWTEANDLNQWLSPEAKKSLAWEQTSFEQLAPGIVCLLDVDNPLSRGDERAYVQQILSKNPSTKRVLVAGDTFTLVAYMVQHG